MAVAPMLLVVIYLIWVGFENRQGRLAWNSAVGQVELGGVIVDHKEFIASRTPKASDSDNYWATPLLQSLWKGSQRADSTFAPDDQVSYDRITSVGVPYRFPKLDLPEPEFDVTLGKGRDLGYIRDGLASTGFKEAIWQAAAGGSGKRGSDAAAILAVLEKDRAVWDELADAVDRPEVFVPVAYSSLTAETFEELNGMFLGWANPSTELIKELDLRTVAAVHHGDRKTARDSLAIAFRIPDWKPANLIGYLVALTHYSILTQGCVWEALNANSLGDEDLIWLAAQLEEVDAGEILSEGLRGELVYVARLRDLMIERPGDAIRSTLSSPSFDVMYSSGSPPALTFKERAESLWKDTLAGLAPAGWIDQNLALSLRLIHRDAIEPLRLGLNTAYQSSDPPELERPRIYNYAARQSFKMQRNMIQRACELQARIDMARLACLIELHQRKHGDYPAGLEDLGLNRAEILDVIPREGAQRSDPFGYKRTKDGRYKLWSIGDDRKDDGGTVNMKSIEFLTIDRDDPGDWVWGYGIENICVETKP